MSNAIKKILENKSYFLYIFHSLYFNFRFLPFRQAIKLPILLIRPHFIQLKGKIEIDDAVCSFGIVKLGNLGAKAFPSTGIKINMQGGTWKINGKCWIGANSSIEIGRHGLLIMEDDFVSSTSLKVFCYRQITFCRGSHFGWECIVLDTNFHPLKDCKTGTKKVAGAPIFIGEYNWFGSRCVIMPGVKTPKRCIFGFGSIVTRNIAFEEYAVHAGSPMHVVSKGYYRDYSDDKDPAVYGPFED